MTAVGRSLELYYTDGQPDGMVTAELFNWTGHVLKVPRIRLAEAIAREETGYAGVYLLLGEQGDEARAYIGEAEDIGTRIRQHAAQKDWWTQAVLVTAAANKLNKAHVRYLEARLIAEARAIGRLPLDNGVAPALPSLSEADVAKMETFLDNLLVVLPAVRVDMFIRRARPASAVPSLRSTDQPAPHQTSGTSPADDVPFVLEARRHGLRATAVLRDGEFIVEQGSTARTTWVGAETHSYASLHAELVRSGVVVVDGDRAIFSQNYAFNSPSAAAAVVYGRSANGPTAWRLAGEALSYKDWEERRLAQLTERPL